MSIADNAVAEKAATKGRVSYGIVLKVGAFVLNEWGLSETLAKQVHEKLVKRGDKPFTVGGIEFSRREQSELAAALAAFDAAPDAG